MQTMPNGSIVRQLEHLFRHGAAPIGDRALLEWFVAEGDEAAFEALVARHGPMVRGVCRRLLGSRHDADDAFQATFLVLVQKARGLRDADRLGPWLYGVATRVANRARVRAAGRRDRFGTLVDDIASRDDPSAADWLDVRPILDAELGQLPAKYRDVLVICLIEGSTAEEAAHQLACPVGTVKSRLARGREALRTRLTGRGLAPASVAAVMAGAAGSAVASPVPPSLLRTTLQTVAQTGSSSAGLPPAVAALTRGVAPNMFSKSSVMAAVALGGLALSGLGITAWIKSPVMAQDEAAGAAAGNPAQAINGVRQQARRAQTVNHMKMIMLAMHNYASVNNRFPPAAIYDKNGRPLLSWRVALLPYLEQGALYEAFHKDEPWDSPHNMKLMRNMPAVFTTPDSPAAEHATRIQGFQGPRAFFEGTEGVAIPDITDGTSNTLAVTLSDVATVWTKPGDLPFIDGAQLPALDASDPNGYIVALADGSVHTLPKDAKGMPDLLKCLITRNGGEVVEMPNVRIPGPAGAGAGGELVIRPERIVTTSEAMVKGGTPANATPPPLPDALEKRLQRLEDKLDRILQKLDAGGPTGAGGGGGSVAK